MEANPNRFNGQQAERREEVQDLNSFFRNTLEFMVLIFNCLSSKNILNLLATVQQIPPEFQARFNAFVLIILSKGKTPEIYGSNNETIPIADILGCFSDENCPQLKNKPKLFFFQTTTNIPDCMAVHELQKAAAQNEHLQHLISLEVGQSTVIK